MPNVDHVRCLRVSKCSSMFFAADAGCILMSSTVAEVSEQQQKISIRFALAPAVQIFRPPSQVGRLLVVEKTSSERAVEQLGAWEQRWKY